MTDRSLTDNADLFRRWQEGSGESAPDALTLAAFADGRLGATEAREVERWLAAHPAAAEDVEIARALALLGEPPRDAVAERIAARAASLVPGAGAGAEIVALPSRPARVFALRRTATWIALAASIAVTAWLGFSLGTDAYGRLGAGDETASFSDMVDPPTGLFGVTSEAGTT
jgi:anti-sigma factor RsiW